MKTKERILEIFADVNLMYNNPNMYDGLSRLLDELIEEARTVPKWIPIKTREMTQEELETIGEEIDADIIFECELPEHGQEVLITTRWGTVEKTTFCNDYGAYFEDYEDSDDVAAWAPLPEPYNAESEKV